MFASAHDFPKFVKVDAAMEHELRKVGTSPNFGYFSVDVRAAENASSVRSSRSGVTDT